MADQLTGLLSPFLRSQRIAAARAFIGQESLLDIGCGTGDLARYVDPSRYVGVDQDAESIAIAKKRLPSYEFQTLDEFSNLTVSNSQVSRESEGKERKFDQIAGLAVIEHVDDPQQWLGWLRTLLKPGGRIVLTTPHPSVRWLHELGARIGLFSREGAREHRELIDWQRMTGLADGSGFRICHFQRFLLGCNQLFVLEWKTD